MPRCPTKLGLRSWDRDYQLHLAQELTIRMKNLQKKHQRKKNVANELKNSVAPSWRANTIQHKLNFILKIFFQPCWTDGTTISSRNGAHV